MDEPVKRGRGRPRKVVVPVVWSEVSPTTVVKVSRIQGLFSFVKLEDEGVARVCGLPNNPVGASGFRWFPTNRLTIVQKAKTDE